MKKAGILMTVLVLTVSVLAGCGCRNSKPANTSEPTTLPTVTTAPTTEMTTVPTTADTEPSTNATIQDGNGPLSTDSTEDTSSGNARSGGIMGSSGNGNSGIMGGTGSGNGITGSITG